MSSPELPSQLRRSIEQGNADGHQMATSQPSRTDRDTVDPMILIKCGSWKYSVRRTLLSSVSRTFQASCVKQSQDPLLAGIDLSEHELDVVHRLMQFIVKGEYSDFERDEFLNQAKLFAAAVKYGIQKLSWMAMMSYSCACDRRWDVHEFLRSIPFIFDSDQDAFHNLRMVAVQEGIRAHIDAIKANPASYTALRSTCMKVPEFSFAMVDDFVRFPLYGQCLSCAQSKPLRPARCVCALGSEMSVSQENRNRGVEARPERAEQVARAA